MWKLILLLSVPIFAQAKIEDFFGIWTQTAYAPETSYMPFCMQFSFTKASENFDCTCADGTKATLVAFKFLNDTDKSDILLHPVVVADGSNLAKLNITCTCGPKDYESRVEFRSINEDNFIMFDPQDAKDTTPSNTGYNTFTFAKLNNVPSAAELNTMLQNISELKGEPISVMCTKERLQESE